MLKNPIDHVIAIRKLALLEEVIGTPDGIYEEGTPPSGVARALAEEGMLEVLEPDGFFGGKYRITDKGREYHAKFAAPIGDW